MKVSVIVPVYNVGLYVAQCIESICNQTYKEMEIILVDDGSTDNSGLICDKMAQTDSRIQVIHKENGGLVSARKTGINMAQGEWILNVDGDDWIEPNMVETLVKRSVETSAEIVQCGFLLEESGLAVDKRKFEKYSLKLDDVYRKKLYVEWMKFDYTYLDSQIFNKLFKRELFVDCYNCLDNETNLGEDQFAFVYYLKVCNTISSVSDLLYHYRIRRDSLSHESDKVVYILKEDDFIRKMSLLLAEQLADKFQVKEEIREWVIDKKLNDLSYLVQDEQSILYPRFAFNNLENYYDKRVVIYGAGAVGRELVLKLMQFAEINVVAWLDKNPSKCNCDFIEIQDSKELANLKYDLVIVAVRKKEMFEEIQEELLTLGVKKNQIIWQPTMSVWQEVKDRLLK